MTVRQLVWESLRHYRRIHWAVVAGVMAATAVLTGALLVGDSMRGSLRDLALNRLCSVERAMLSPTFFRQKLAEEATAAGEKHLAAGISLTASLTSAGDERHTIAPKVNLLGVDQTLWAAINTSGAAESAPSPPVRPSVAPIAAQSIVLNRPLAEQLRVKQGDEVLVYLPRQSEIPADSPLGKKSGALPSLRLTVQQIVDSGGANFSLQPNQQLPLNAFVDLETLQQPAALDRPQQVNAIFQFLDANSKTPPSAAQTEHGLHPKLEDYGLHLAYSPKGFLQITSDRMLLPDTLEAAVAKQFPEAQRQPTLTYLANYILAGDGRGKIPYSTITALDPSVEPPLGPLETIDGSPLKSLADDEIALNSWAADDLKQQGVDLHPGDWIQLTFFDPESTHGVVSEQTAGFKLKSIVKLAGAADDASLTPELKGVSDKKSIRNWTPPFPYDQDRVRSIAPNSQDDDYWKKYKTTPKGFISLAAGRKWWASRFGKTTTIRLAIKQFSVEQPPTQRQLQTLSDELAARLDPARLGLAFQPVRAQALQAAKGTTEFNGLFIGFSLFIIVSALMLVAILFRLGIEQRAAEIGLLLALGWRRKQVHGLLLREGALVAAVGAAIGVLVGLGYAWLMLVGLNTLWVKAITEPFVKLHVTGVSLAIGFVSGLAISVLTILYALRQMKHVPNRQLLAGQMGEPNLTSKKSARLPLAVALLLLTLAVVAGVFARQLGGMEQAGAFFSAGLLTLAAGMTLVWLFLRRGESLAAIRGAVPLARLAVRNAGRNPGRSTLSVGLMAAAAFLIVAIGAFRLDPPSATPNRDSGDGGFSLYAEADQPINQDLMQPQAGVDQLLGDDALATLQADGAKIFALRGQAGDDASCLNLYQSRQPRVLGIPDSMLQRGGFAWQAVDKAADAQQQKNPWLLLKKSLSDPPGDAPTAPIPVVLDQNTAMYSLHLFGGPGETLEITVAGGRKQKLQIVGLLDNSLFQGVILMSEANLLRLFPEVSGYHAFLVEARGDNQADVKQLLESELADYGFAAELTSARLERFAGVQNTYLATFQSLGGLGLLLGTFGLATVQLRSVFERRGELALLRATGFRRQRLARMVLLENTALLLAGLTLGTLAALAAVFPQLFGGRAHLPWAPLAATLGLVLLTGLIAGLLAVRATLKAPLLPALRGE